MSGFFSLFFIHCTPFFCSNFEWNEILSVQVKLEHAGHNNGDANDDSNVIIDRLQTKHSHDVENAVKCDEICAR